MLHTINKSSFQSDSLSTCLRCVQGGEPILLIEDAVYAAANRGKFAEQVQGQMASNPIYALSGDLKARGVSSLIDGVTVIDYEGFVELVEQHQVNSWL